jgi:putative transposase
MMDLTEIPGLFRIFSFKLAVVIDVFSRMPLATRVFLAEPGAEAVAGLITLAASSHGAPRHFVSDQGAQFTAEAFRAGLKTLGIRQRFGAIGKTGSIAIVERLWRTLKEALGSAP